MSSLTSTWLEGRQQELGKESPYWLFTIDYLESASPSMFSESTSKHVSLKSCGLWKRLLTCLTHRACDCMFFTLSMYILLHYMVLSYVKVSSPHHICWSVIPKLHSGNPLEEYCQNQVSWKLRIDALLHHQTGTVLVCLNLLTPQHHIPGSFR